MSPATKTDSAPSLDAAGARTVMNYVECTLAADLTLPEWRRARAASNPHRRLGLRRRLAGGRHPAH
jgi:hypothetical protein